MCDHLTTKDFDTDDVNATLAELAAKLQLTAEETELLDSVVMLYGSKSQNGLIFLTHAEQPWVEAREGLAPYQRSEKEMSLATSASKNLARCRKFVSLPQQLETKSPQKLGTIHILSYLCIVNTILS